MKTISFKDFLLNLAKCYAVDIDPDARMDGDLWRTIGESTRICLNWRGPNLEKIRWIGKGEYESKIENLINNDIQSFSIHNASEIRLLHYFEDEIKYDNENDVYHMTHNREKYIDSGEKDDDGYTIYNATGTWIKEPVKLVMLYRKSAIV